MGANADTAVGTTITFGTSGFTASYEEIDAGEDTRSPIEVTDLASTNQKEFMPEDLIDPGETTAIFQWNQSFGTFPPITAARETVTITYPLKTGESTAAKVAGTAFLTRRRGPVARIGAEIMRGEFTLKWDGGHNSGTEKAYTAGS